MSIKIGRKLTTKTVMGLTPKELRKLAEDANGQPVLLWTAYGQATRVQEGESDYGPYTALVGSFEAINHLTGETFHAPKLHLEQGAQNLVVGQILKDMTEAIEFGFSIYVEEDEKSATGYVYSSTPVIEYRSPIETLRAKVMDALPAPENKDTKKLANAKVEKDAANPA